MHMPEVKSDIRQVIDVLVARLVFHRYPKELHQLSGLNLGQIFQCDLAPRRAPINVRVVRDLAQLTLGESGGSHNLEESRRG